MKAAIPPDEPARLQELERHGILPGGSNPVFDSLAKLASFVCGTPEGYVSLIDADRQVFKGTHGKLGPATSRDVAFCAHAILGRDALIVPDATQDARFSDNPLVLDDPRIRFYAGIPLQSPSGFNLGTLCVIDYAPRTLTAKQLEALEALARQVEAQLDLHRQLHLLVQEVQTASACDQPPVTLGADLLALAVHDIKSPLTAILANGHFALEAARSESAREAALGVVEAGEVATRMISDLLDVTLAQAGRMKVRTGVVELAAVFLRLRRAMELSARDRSARLEVPDHVTPRTLRTDPELFRRILENLVENGLKYGRGGRVTVGLAPTADGQWVELSVSDQGPGIDPAVVRLMFEPNISLPGDPERGGRGPSRGLGLYFCRLAAEALGGDIRVEPNEPHGARFIVRLPVTPVG